MFVCSSLLQETSVLALRLAAVLMMQCVTIILLLLFQLQCHIYTPVCIHVCVLVLQSSSGHICSTLGILIAGTQVAN